MASKLPELLRLLGTFKFSWPIRTIHLGSSKVAPFFFKATNWTVFTLPKMQLSVVITYMTTLWNWWSCGATVDDIDRTAILDTTNLCCNDLCNITVWTQAVKIDCKILARHSKSYSARGENQQPTIIPKLGSKLYTSLSLQTKRSMWTG